MRHGRSVVAAMALMLAAYAAAPYVAIWQIMQAARSGNSGVLAARIDWQSVRAGLKADIAQGLMGDFAAGPETPAAQAMPVSTSGARLQANTLPPFGASFFSGIAGSVVDREVTADHLAALMREAAPADSENRVMSLPLGSIRHAFFINPTSFELNVLCPGQDADDEPLRIRLKLRESGWTVVRAWVPQDLVDLANSRT